MSRYRYPRVVRIGYCVVWLGSALGVFIARGGRL